MCIEFEDHVEGSSPTCRFRVYGEVASVTKTSISVDSWAYADRKQKHDSNETRFTIVRAAIHRIIHLTERRDGQIKETQSKS